MKSLRPDRTQRPGIPSEKLYQNSGQGVMQSVLDCGDAINCSSLRVGYCYCAAAVLPHRLPLIQSYGNSAAE